MPPIETKATYTAGFFRGNDEKKTPLWLRFDVDKKFEELTRTAQEILKNHRAIADYDDVISKRKGNVESAERERSREIAQNQELNKILKSQLEKLEPKERAEIWGIFHQKDLVSKTPAPGITRSFGKEMLDVFISKANPTQIAKR